MDSLIFLSFFLIFLNLIFKSSNESCISTNTVLTSKNCLILLLSHFYGILFFFYEVITFLISENINFKKTSYLFIVSIFSKLLLCFSIFFLSRTVKSLRFYPTCRLTGQPSTVAGTLAEFMRLLGQRQGTLLLLEMLQP